jgi:hypothetical protein
MAKTSICSDLSRFGNIDFLSRFSPRRYDICHANPVMNGTGAAPATPR